MEILVATFAMFSYLFSGAPASASASPNNNPYILIQEYQTKQECKIAIAHTDDICTTEPDLYLGTRQYSKDSGRGEVYKNNVCNSISGCPVIKDTCPTCTESKWYLMND
jgi:hypothetical protein